METSHYFYRNVIFSKQGKTISLIDIYHPKSERKELDSWFGMILQLADGQHTVEQMIQFMGGQYNGIPPKNLRNTLVSVVDRMVKAKLIMLTEEPTDLPYYLSMPYEMLDIDKAKKKIAQDRVDINYTSPLLYASKSKKPNSL
jgi:hypothetical protein